MKKAEETERIREHFEGAAPDWDRWKARNAYYYRELERMHRFHIPPGASVLEVGCATGDLLAATRPGRGLGIDLSPAMVERAREKHPELEFRVGDAEDLDVDETFDYVLLSNLIGELQDVQQAFARIRKVCHRRTRVVITYYNYLWEPLLWLGQRLGWKRRQRIQNWFFLSDIEGLLGLEGFEVVKQRLEMPLPRFVPHLSGFVNRVIGHLPGTRNLGLVQFVVARPMEMAPEDSEPSVTVVVPCRNERGNIAEIFRRIPRLGRHTEVIFIDGSSTDGTAEEIERCMEEEAPRADRSYRLLHQGDGVGKGDAVRKAFAVGKNDVFMILDADLSVAPEDLTRFFRALVDGRGEFINGSRMVYPMERQAMRFLNLIGNTFFSLMFTYLLEQRFRDTLCGTKVLYREDYQRIVAGRHFFGDFDPFGDFDLIFGASKLDLAIVEIPIRYHERTYGTTNISRFRHGWLLLRMCMVAMRKLKFV